MHPTLSLPGGHGAAQFVRPARRKASSLNGDLHHLLLKNGHTQGALECFFKLRLFQLERQLTACTLACQQIGVDHAALNRTGPHDGDLDHQIIKSARQQARQHAHLGPTLDLEGAHGIGAANHGVGGRILLGNLMQRP